MWSRRKYLFMDYLPSLVKHFKQCNHFQKHLLCSFSLRTFFSGSQVNQNSHVKQTFKPKKAVVLSKVTRYEYEKLLFGKGTEEELIQNLRSKMSDYYGLLQRHNIHLQCVKNIKRTLEDLEIETKVVQRFDFDANLIKWADIVISAGGDGTFLSAASKITNRDKAVIGINTDPSRSEGYLCLPKIKTANLKSMKESFNKLLSGEFRWRWRQRIRISMSGKYMYDDPVELHDQQLHCHEHRFIEHIKENEMFHNKSATPQETSRILPLLALNEVFMGESLSSRVSYYELSIDENPRLKLKSSGITVCTGTGSSSWHFHINHVPYQSVHEILKLGGCVSSSNAIATNFTFYSSGVDKATSTGRVANCDLKWDNEIVREVTENFNQSLWFDPEIPKMAYTIRDPVMNSVFQISNTRGCVQKIKVHSRMWDACLVIDGGSSFTFNDGAEATLEINEEDALRTISLD